MARAAVVATLDDAVKEAAQVQVDVVTTTAFDLALGACLGEKKAWGASARGARAEVRMRALQLRRRRAYGLSLFTVAGGGAE